MPRPPISDPSPAERHPVAVPPLSGTHIRLPLCLDWETSGIRGIPADQRRERERPSATSSPPTTSSITSTAPPEYLPIHHETVSDPPCRRRREEARTVHGSLGRIRLPPTKGHRHLRPRAEPPEPARRHLQRRGLQHLPPHPPPDPVLGSAAADCLRDHAVGD